MDDNRTPPVRRRRPPRGERAEAGVEPSEPRRGPRARDFNRRVTAISGGVLAVVVVLFVVVLAATAPSPAIVRIRIDGPTDDVGVTVSLDGTFRPAEEFLQPVELEPGEHEVIVRRGMRVLATHRFELVRGANPDVNVALGRTPERAAAERVLSLGGTLTIAVNGASRAIDGVGQFPDEPFEIQEIRLAGCDVLTDADVIELAEFGTLRRCDLSDTPITAASVSALAPLERLIELDLSGTLISDASLPPLSAARELRRLALDRTAVTDEGVASLIGLSKLAELSLSGTGVTDAGLESLGDLHSLARLVLTGTEVTEQAVQRFQESHPDCRVDHDPFVNRQEQALARWVLEQGGTVSLRIGDTERPVAAAASLPARKYLVSAINLSRSRWSEEDELAILQTASGLEWLSFRGTSLGDAGLEYLHGAPELASLDLRQTSVTGEGLRVLGQLPKLRELFLSAGQIDGEGFSALADAQALEKLVLEDVEFTGEVAGILAGLPRLTALALPGTSLTDDACPALATLSRLRTLDVSDATRVTDAGAASLLQLSQLEELNLSGTQVSDGTAAALAGLPRLRRIDVTRTAVTYSAIAALKQALPECEVLGGRMGSYELDLSQVPDGELPPGWTGNAVGAWEILGVRAIGGSHSVSGRLSHPELRLEDDFYVELEVCDSDGKVGDRGRFEFSLLVKQQQAYDFQLDRDSVVFRPGADDALTLRPAGLSARNISFTPFRIIRFERRGRLLRILMDGLLAEASGAAGEVPVTDDMDLQGLQFRFPSPALRLTRLRSGPLPPQAERLAAQRAGQTVPYAFTASRTNAKSGRLPPQWTRIAGTPEGQTRLRIAPLEIAADFALEFTVLAHETSFRMTLTARAEGPDVPLSFERRKSGAWQVWLPGAVPVALAAPPGNTKFLLERRGQLLTLTVNDELAGTTTLTEPGNFDGLLFDVDGSTLRFVSLRVRPLDDELQAAPATGSLP